MTVETTVSKPNIARRIINSYGQMRGLWPGGKEWLKRRDTVIALKIEALEMEREGKSPDEIFDHLKSSLDQRGIKWCVGTNPFHPLSNPKEHKFQRNIVINHAGDNTQHLHASGLELYTEGDAYALDHNLFKPISS